MAGFIVGFDSDTETIFDRQIDFIQESGIVTAMVGLLQAPYGTALYDRMKDENRLLTEMSGNNADGETNIIPLMPKELLANGYRKIIATIYSPRQFYARVQTFLEHYHPVTHAVTIEPNEIIALFRTIWHMGIIGSERKYYWKLFFWTLFHRPDLFPIAITLTVYGYHFGKVRDDILFHQKPETVSVSLPA
jgi:hypothetical protein